ncbi:MAG: MurR/RpiR family transcriptional regulator [Clostridia bacterium]|nr:MurR/RpiR family transcriptional regulator [Clostridia bacterium]
MIIAKIHNAFKNLTDAEKKIASFILKSPHNVVNMTIKQLADECKTAQSAVNRMCKSIGVEGFSNLKIELASSIGKASVSEKIVSFNKDDTPAMIFKNVFNSGITTLKNTFNMLDFSVAESMAKKISNANRVFIFGIGTSSVIAMDAAYRFSQLGVQAYAYTDILQMQVMAKNMKIGDVAFGISHSGKTKTVVDAMRLAKESGAITVALTSFSKNLLYKESDLAISVYADEENYPVEAVSARIAHMCVVDALMMTIASFEYDDYSKHISMRNKALDEIRY